MCAVCGCGTGEVRIEGRAAAGGHAHSHGGAEHVHDHVHAGGHDDDHDHGHDHAHGHGGAEHVHDHVHAGGHEDDHDHGHGHAHSHAHSHGGAEHVHAHVHAGGHDDDHDHGHDHGRGHGRGQTGAQASAARLVEVERAVLARNDAFAGENRRAFFDRGVLALNLVSSPGSGKTSLLVETVKRLAGSLPVAVIEGDQQTMNDAERIRATGAPAIQINTGKGCHLDAHMVGHAFDNLPLAPGGVLFIENVGNLVCPAGFDLGEAHKVVILSVTEGEDKPLKYPDMFLAADLMLLNKTDLLPHLDFDVAACVANARRVNARLKVLSVSARDGTGMDAWLGWLKAARAMALTGSPALDAEG